jgi:hypothetical protein
VEIQILALHEKKLRGISVGVKLGMKLRLFKQNVAWGGAASQLEKKLYITVPALYN